MLKSLINIYKGQEKENKSNDNNNILLNYFISSSKRLDILSSFIKEIYNNILLTNDSFNKKIILLKNNENTNKEQINQLNNNNSLIEKIIQSFYDNTLLHLNEVTQILNKFNELIIIPFNEFKTEYDNKNLLLINKLSSLKNNFNEEKNKILYYQNKYFLDKQEYYNFYKNINNKENKPDQILLSKIKNDLEIDKELYKYQLDYFNSFYKNEFLKKFKKTYLELENIDNDKNYFLRNIIYLYNNNLDNYKKSLEKYISLMNSIFTNIKNEKNILFKEFNENDEDLINYENEVKKINKEFKIMSKEISDIYKNKQLNIPFNNNYKSLFINNNIIKDNKDNLIENKNIILSKYFEHLYKKEKIPLKIICKINYLLFNYDDFYLIFIEEFLKGNKDTNFIEINNLFNLKHLSFILKSKISLYLNNNVFLLFLLLGQEIYYSGDNKKIYLCNLLNKMPLFNLVLFWKNLIKLLFKFIISKSDNINIINYDFLISMIKKVSFDDINTSNESSLNNMKYKYKTYDKVITNIDNFISIINNYDELINKKSEDKIKEIFVKIHKILLLYISFLINYNFGISQSIELLNQICNKLSISPQIINYYIFYLHNYSYSIKNNISKKNKNSEDIYLSSLDKKKLIISNIIKYLENEDLLKILVLNKKYNKEVKDEIYKIILKRIKNKKQKDKNEELNKKLYINIWKNILNYNEIKNLYPYEENKEKALQIKYNRHHNGDFAIIDVDCIRTNFINEKQEEKTEDKRKILNNILKTLMMLFKECNYCQGMNYLVAFILSICNNDEEEAFYLSLSFLKKTTYKNIFLHDLKILRLYFAIFDKLLYIFIPTIYSKINLNKIYCNYYISPWFITLFTYLIDEKTKIEPFIEILNLFILYGWKSIFSISLNIFNYFEKTILNVKSENLLQFLNSELSIVFINNINNFDFDYFENNQIEISSKLIDKIEEEFSQILLLVEEYE